MTGGRGNRAVAVAQYPIPGVASLVREPAALVGLWQWLDRLETSPEAEADNRRLCMDTAAKHGEALIPGLLCALRIPEKTARRWAAFTLAEGYPREDLLRILRNSGPLSLEQRNALRRALKVLQEEYADETADYQEAFRDVQRPRRPVFNRAPDTLRSAEPGKKTRHPEAGNEPKAPETSASRRGGRWRSFRQPDGKEQDRP